PTAARSNPATILVLPPLTAPCPVYFARLGRCASANTRFTSAVPLIYETPTSTFTVKCVASCTVIPLNCGSNGPNLFGSVRKSYTSSGVRLTSNSPPNLIAMAYAPDLLLGLTRRIRLPDAQL